MIFLGEYLTLDLETLIGEDGKGGLDLGDVYLKARFGPQNGPEWAVSLKRRMSLFCHTSLHPHIAMKYKPFFSWGQEPPMIERPTQWGKMHMLALTPPFPFLDPLKNIL